MIAAHVAIPPAVIRPSVGVSLTRSDRLARKVRGIVARIEEARVPYFALCVERGKRSKKLPPRDSEGSILRDTPKRLARWRDFDSWMTAEYEPAQERFERAWKLLNDTLSDTDYVAVICDGRYYQGDGFDDDEAPDYYTCFVYNRFSVDRILNLD